MLVVLGGFDGGRCFSCWILINFLTSFLLCFEGEEVSLSIILVVRFLLAFLFVMVERGGWSEKVFYFNIGGYSWRYDWFLQLIGWVAWFLQSFHRLLGVRVLMLLVLLSFGCLFVF